MRSMLIKITIAVLMRFVCFASVSLLPVTVHAVNFATAAKSLPGYQLKLYPFYYGADIRTDKDGNHVVTDLGLKRYGVMVGTFYQIGDVQLNAIVPVVRLEVDKQKDKDAGIGDIQLRAGWNLPVEWMSIMPALMVKSPTGSYDKNRKVNLSDGQTDLVAELYLFKLLQPFSFDALFKYNIRFRNSDTGITPGNEFIAEGLFTCRIAEKIRIGPAINFIKGADNKKAGKTVADSGLMRLAAGGEIYYGRFEKIKISLAAYRDLLTRNTNEGFTVMSRIAIDF
jgi:hypothetical protein